MRPCNQSVVDHSKKRTVVGGAVRHGSTCEASSGAKAPRARGKKGERGTTLVEVAFVLPVLIVLLFGCFDLGFLFYSSIAVENAARAAVMDTSASVATSGNSATACADVIAALQAMPNQSSFSTGCGGSPLTVSAQAATGKDGSSSSLVTVTYSTIRLIPVPWVSWMTGSFTISRTAQMRCRA